MAGTGSGRAAAAVAIVAGAAVGFEIVAYQAITYVNDHFTAMHAIASALMGVSIGGLLAYLAPDDERLDRVALGLMPFVILAGLPVIARVNPWPTAMAALLTLPYVVAAFYVSRSFERLGAARAYAADLGGAALGAILTAIAVPWLREEGTLFLLAGVASVAPWLVARTGRSLAPIALPVVLLALHVAVDPFNLGRIATADSKLWAGKLFLKSDLEILYSRGSLIERIDIVRKKGSKKSWTSYYNGKAVDAITSDKAEYGRLDNRMPTRLKAGADPDTLLVGPSGQGLCKAVQALGNGRIDAVEINAAIAGLMSDEMYERSGRAYERFDLTVGDVRSFLAATDRKYDFITLLNTHRIWSMGHQGPAEYVHTLEAMRAYLSHLEDDGWVLFEERNINERADLGIRRVVGTTKAALVEAGVADPTQHFAIWELWHGCPPARWEAQRCSRSKLFTFVMVKRTPITAAEEEHLIEWGKVLGERPTKSDYRGIVWRYLPGHPTEHVWTDVVRADSLYELPGVDPALHELSVVTDDKPYPYDVFRDREAVVQMVRQIGLLAAFMVLLPALPLLPRPRAMGRAAPGLVVAGALGIAYLVVEIVLVQQLGIFLWSPAWSLTIVLATMLLASGLGSFYSERLGRAGALVAGLAAAGGAALAAWGLGPLVESLMWLPFLPRIAVVAVVVGPLAFAMGIPFPWLLGGAREALGPRHGALLFAVNGAVSAMAAPVALLASMTWGFHDTMLGGAAAYAVAALVLFVVPRQKAA